MSLKGLAVSGIKWSAISQISRQGMQLTTTIVLARLLAPSAFGLVGMAVVVTGFVAIFKDLGTSAAIVQREQLSEELVQSIFWLNVLFGVVATVALACIAPIAAQLYQEPGVSPLLRALSLTFFISGLSVLQQAILERRLEFNKLAKIEIFATLLGSVTGIAAAMLQCGAWSLVYQAIAITTTTTILLWSGTTWRPKPIFVWREIQSVLNYSLNLTGFSIFNYLVRNADYFLIGRFLGSQALGYYTLAYRIMLYPLQNVASVVGRVLFPVLSKIQSDHAKFRYAYLNVVRIISLITLPIALSLCVLSAPLVLTLFGSPWTPTIPLLIIFAPIGAIQSIGTTVGVIYQAKERTDWMLYWGIFTGAVVLTAFSYGLKWGITGVAGAYAIASLLLTYPNFWIPFQLIQLKMNDLLKVLWRSVVCSCLMVAILFGLTHILPANLASAWRLGSLVLTGAAVYLWLSWWLNREPLQQLLGLVRGKP